VQLLLITVVLFLLFKVVQLLLNTVVLFLLFKVVHLLLVNTTTLTNSYHS